MKNGITYYRYEKDIKTMKIAIDLTHLTHEFRGGQEQVIRNLLVGITETSIEVELIIFCYKKIKKKIMIMAPNAIIIAFEKKRYTKPILQNFYLRTFKFHFYLKDVDILFFPFPYTGFGIFRIPTVVLPHDIQFKTYPYSSKLINFIVSILYFTDFWLRDYIIAISDFDKNEIVKHYPKFIKKIKRIYNPIRIEKNPIKFKEKYFLAINIGYDHKNIITLIKAYALVVKEYDIPLILVGKMYNTINVHELVDKYRLTKKVQYLGYVDEKKLNELLANAYVYITTSKYEGFGMTAVEAIFHEVPVISSTQEALIEVTLGKSFYYKPFDNKEELANVIIKLIKNYPSYNYFLELKKDVYLLFDYQIITKKYLDFFAMIIKSSYRLKN